MQNCSNMDAEVDGVMAATTAASRSFLRVVTVDVAKRAAMLGMASDRVGPWEIFAWRVAFGDGPTGENRLVLTLTCSGRLVLRWPANVPATGSLQ